MRPYIICHMMSSVDGRIDCAMIEKIDNTDNYWWRTYKRCLPPGNTA